MARRTAPAVFDLSPGELDGAMVRHRGVTLFEAGDYKAKRFSMTPDELRAAAEAFKAPVPLELEHINSEGTATFLDGEYGTVENVQAIDDGKRFIGDIVLDPWVDRKWKKYVESTGRKARQVSAVWDRASKSLQIVGMVIRGHVPAAAFSAAFSDRTDDTKLDALFTARKTTPEMTHHMQGIHDHVAVLQPNLCGATFGDRPKQAKALGKIHDYAVEHGARCPKMTAQMSDSQTGDARKVNMTAKEKLSRALFGDKSDAPALSITDEQADAALAALEPKVPDAAALFAASPQGQAMQAKIAALEAENEKARQAAAQTDAVRFSEDVVRSGRIPPVLKQDFARLILRFAADDHTQPATVTFSDAKTSAEKTGTRVEALMEFVAKLPKSLHDAPAFDPTVGLGDKFRALFNDEGDSASGGSAKTPEQIRKELLSKTDAGRAALKARA